MVAIRGRVYDPCDDEGAGVSCVRPRINPLSGLYVLTAILVLIYVYIFINVYVYVYIDYDDADVAEQRHCNKSPLNPGVVIAI